MAEEPPGYHQPIDHEPHDPYGYWSSKQRERAVCPVCLATLKDPHIAHPKVSETHEEHVFCKKCITRLGDEFACPICRAQCKEEEIERSADRRKEIESFQIYCDRRVTSEDKPFYKRPRALYPHEETQPITICGWNGTHGEWNKNSKKHSMECPLTRVRCRYCREICVRREIEHHRLEECKERSVQCDHCKETLIFRNLHAHEKICKKKQTECDLKNIGCGWKGTQQAHSRHKSSGAGKAHHLDLAMQRIRRLRQALGLEELVQEPNSV